MRRGIQRWIVAVSHDAGRRARRLTSSGTVAFLVASAIAPIAQPLLDPKASGLATALAGQIGAVGANYLTELVARVVDRLREGRPDGEVVPEEALRDALAETLTERLERGDERLATEIAAVLAAVDGVQAALDAAVEASASEVQQVLVEGFTTLGGSFEQFAWMQRDAYTVLSGMQSEQMRQGMEQRHQTDLVRRSLVTTMLLARQLAAHLPQPAGELPEVGIGAAPVVDLAGGQPASGGGSAGTPEVCPYRGLAAFEPEDAAWFFGREALIAELVVRLGERLTGPSMLMVVGASGSGKSSLLRAGLVPALAQGALPVAGASTWPWLLLTPGPQPLTELAVRIGRLAGVAAGSVLDDLEADPSRLALVVRQALLAEAEAARQVEEVGRGLAAVRSVPLNERVNGSAAGQRLVLIVDQFEELFTAGADEKEHRGFIRALCSAANAPSPSGEVPPALVVVGVRADFFGHCARYSELVDLLQDGQVLVGPMSPTAVRRAIEAPAAAAGLRLEPGLVEVLLRDAGLMDSTDGDSDGGGLAVGVLPLLSHALLETWRHRQRDTLTLAGYQATGGIRAAVATTAEACYQALNPTEQATARQVLLRLVALGDGIEPTRRRVSRAEFLHDRPTEQTAAIATVLDRLIGARLVTSDHDTVEVTHEALLQVWPRLRGWLSDDREGLRVHRQLTEAAQAWAALDRDPGALYQGTRLAAASEWAADLGRSADLTPLERDFLDSSLNRQASEQRAARRRTRRLRRLNGALAALLVLTLIATGLAVQQRDQARGQRRVAVSRAIVGQSTAVYPTDQLTSLLLGVAAVRIAPTMEARSNLLDLADRNRLVAVLNSHTLNVSGVAFSPDARTLVTAGGDAGLQLWDVERRAPRATFSNSAQPSATGVAFSPDGHTVATANADKTVRLWDVERRTLKATMHGHPDGVYGIAFSPDGRTLASADADSKVRIWNVERGALKATFTNPAGTVTAVAFSPDGRTLAIAGPGAAVRLWDVKRRVLLATLTNPDSELSGVAFSPDGQTLAAAGNNEAVWLWDVRRRALVDTIMTGHHGDVSAVAFSPNGRVLATASGADETVRLWDTTRRTLGLTGLVGTRDEVDDSTLAFSQDGQNLATAELQQDTVWLWDIGRRVPLAALTNPTTRDVTKSGQEVHLVLGMALSPDGRIVATTNNDDAVRLWDVRRRVLLATFHHQPSGVAGVAFSPDGRTLATASTGSLRLWDVKQGAVLTTLKLGELPGRSRVAFSPDGHTVAVTGDGGPAQLWDVRRRVPLGTLECPPQGINKVVFSPGGRTLASACFGGSLVLWDVERRARLATLTTPTIPTARSINGLAFSPDGGTLATAGADGTLRLWEVARRELLATVHGHAGGITGVAFSPDGNILVTTGGDRKVRVRDPDLSRAISRVCNAVGRELTPEQWVRFVPDWPYQHVCERP
jgi:WD40 repeat protein